MSLNDREQAPLSMFHALRSAFCNHDVDYFPRVTDEENGSVLLPTDAMMKRFAASTRSWKIKGKGDLDAAIALARQSLDEVKGQTEYQDNKATRLLTVTTFLSAFAGAVFLKFSAAFPLAQVFSTGIATGVLAILSYVLFGMFVIYAVCGALITFHANRTRFKYARSNQVAEDKAPKSRLFFEAIAGVTPEAWGRAYIYQRDVPSGSGPWLLVDDLRMNYLRDLVGETYLVACKTADKLRILDPAQRFLACALRSLLLWLVSLTALFLISLIPFVSNAAVPAADGETNISSDKSGVAGSQLNTKAGDRWDSQKKNFKTPPTNEASSLSEGALNPAATDLGMAVKHNEEEPRFAN